MQLPSPQYKDIQRAKNCAEELLSKVKTIRDAGSPLGAFSFWLGWVDEANGFENSLASASEAIRPVLPEVESLTPNSEVVQCGHLAAPTAFELVLILGEHVAHLLRMASDAGKNGGVFSSKDHKFVHELMGSVGTPSQEEWGYVEARLKREAIDAQNCFSTIGQTNSSLVDDDTTNYVFRRDGDVWKVRFGVESGSIKDANGMKYIARLLERPNTLLTAETLRAVGEELAANLGNTLLSARSGESVAKQVSTTKECGLEIIDERAIRTCNSRLVEIAKEREAARDAGNTSQIDSLDEEQSKIEKYLSASLNIHGETRLVKDRGRSTYNSVKQAIERAYERMGNADPPLPNLVAHLRSTIEWRNREFEYRPPANGPEWQL